ncbi:DUF3952 domain-containing protein [Bacillus mycoides]|uniref:DUF3952 domain-containing protein n=1 Tax=Bacillus mycoides TaxID=1405 RepID=A0ABC9R1H4_BACMY|nr:DUF3952 domain-containing protein [Bacillus mycoides]EJR39500.1 hypothetical protein III_03341 [Bacillus mycoides]
MKLKKKAKVMIVVSIVASLLSGCGFGEKQIEYERLVKALDEGDIATIIDTSDTGFASIIQSYGLVQKKKDQENQTNVTVENTKAKSVLNIRENIAYGVTSKDLRTFIENDKNKESELAKDIYSNKLFVYESNNFKSKDREIEASKVHYIFNTLKGISSIKPTRDTRGGDEPNSIFYNLTEEEFKNILNDDLKLNYSKFREAKVSLYFSDSRDRKNNPLKITRIRIGIGFEEKQNNQNIESFISISEEFDYKVSNEKNRKEFIRLTQEYSL